MQISKKLPNPHTHTHTASHLCTYIWWWSFLTGSLGSYLVGQSGNFRTGVAPDLGRSHERPKVPGNDASDEVDFATNHLLLESFVGSVCTSCRFPQSNYLALLEEIISIGINKHRHRDDRIAYSRDSFFEFILFIEHFARFKLYFYSNLSIRELMYGVSSWCLNFMSAMI